MSAKGLGAVALVVLVAGLVLWFARPEWRGRLPWLSHVITGAAALLAGIGLGRLRAERDETDEDPPAIPTGLEEPTDPTPPPMIESARKADELDKEVERGGSGDVLDLAAELEQRARERGR